MNCTSEFKTLIIIDLETTGLLHDEPRITELAMIAVNIETLNAMKPHEELPRVLNKFVKFFDPVKLLRIDVAELTGLNNRLLMDYAPFNRETVIAMEAFLSDLQKPMCFVAHNGDQFDFPILLNEIQSALSDPVFGNDKTNQDNHHSTPTISDDYISLCSPSAKDKSVQTITSIDDFKQTSLLSLDCADSLVFFRQIYHLLNDKETVQCPNASILCESPIESNQNGCNNNATVDSMEVISTPTTSADTHHPSPRLGYIEIPIKYTPSPDPTRQRPSMKLSKIYEREFNEQTSHFIAHRAEDDCLMLLAILKRYLPDWLEWLETNHHPLSYFSSSVLPIRRKQSSSNTSVNMKPPLKF